MLKDIDHDSIGYRIRTARKSKELTQKELSAQVGVGPNYLATVERGTKTASEVLLKRIALATDVTLNWLVTGEGEKPTILPGAVLSEKELREIITERAFGMSVEEAIQRGKVSKGRPYRRSIASLHKDDSHRGSSLSKDAGECL